MRLHENKGVRQRPDEGFRRWFVNDYFDIILWYSRKGGELTGYQVCYSKNSNERAFSWKRSEYTSSHFVSDPDYQTGTAGLASNILHGFAGVIPSEAIERLKEDKGELDDDIFNLIIGTIHAFNRNHKEVHPSTNDIRTEFDII